MQDFTFSCLCLKKKERELLEISLNWNTTTIGDALFIEADYDGIRKFQRKEEMFVYTPEAAQCKSFNFNLHSDQNIVLGLEKKVL